MRIMRYAGSAPTLASGANIAAFNIGNAAGAWLGGLTISAGLGYASTIWDGAALSLGALVVLVVADRLARRTSRCAEVTDATAPTAAAASASTPTSNLC